MWLDRRQSNLHVLLVGSVAFCYKPRPVGDRFQFISKCDVVCCWPEFDLASPICQRRLVETQNSEMYSMNKKNYLLKDYYMTKNQVYRKYKFECWMLGLWLDWDDWWQCLVGSTCSRYTWWQLLYLRKRRVSPTLREVEVEQRFAPLVMWWLFVCCNETVAMIQRLFVRRYHSQTNSWSTLPSRRFQCRGGLVSGLCRYKSKTIPCAFGASVSYRWYGPLSGPFRSSLRLCRRLDEPSLWIAENENRNLLKG